MIKKLNAKMKKCIELEIENPSWTYQQLADEVGCSYATIYNYMHSDIYRDTRDQMLREAFRDAMKIAQKAMIRLADTGNYNAAAFILQNGGYNPKTVLDLDIPNKLKIKITGDEDKDG